MPFNGAGVFSRLFNFQQDRDNNIKILADRMDAELDGFATGLSNTIARDGQSTVSANIPFNNRKITGLGNATDPGDALNRATGDARYILDDDDTVKTANIEDGAVTLPKLAPQARVDLASSSTTDIGAASSQYVRVTGTTTITGLGTAAAGVVRDVLFEGALTLTHNATSLILPTGANITTTAGDTALFRSEGSGNWRCIRYAGRTVNTTEVRALNAGAPGSGTTTNLMSGLAKAWASYKGTSPAGIRASFNISSATNNATGNDTFNFTNAMSNTNHSPSMSQNRNHATNYGSFGMIGTPDVGSIQTQTANPAFSNEAHESVFIQTWGDLA